MTSARRITVLVVVAVLLIATFVQLRASSGTEIKAYFSSGTGLYKGDVVKVQGVTVGKVTSVEPRGKQVLVTMSIGDQPIPAKAKAAIVSPSLVNGRFVQLAPGYVKGPTMASGTTIPMARTAVPVSFDEVKKELTDLSTALGPDGKANQGALREAITTLDANLGDGNAARLRGSVEAMREAASDLSDNRGDLFTTVKQLNTFTKNLVVNDASLRGVSTELADFSGTLADNGKQLSQTLSSLRTALQLVRGFLDDNTAVLGASLAKTQKLAKTVSGRTTSLGQILQTSPIAAEGFYATIENQAINGAASLSNFQGTAQLLCGLVTTAGGSTSECRDSIQPLLDVLNLSTLPGAPGNSISRPADEGPATSSADGTGSGASAPDLAGLVQGLTDTSGGGLFGLFGGAR